MNIFNLSSFIEIVNENSISKAAAKLHMSQSALSQQLKILENDLNCKLLERSNRGVVTTEEGDIVYRYSEIFLELYKNMEKEIEEVKVPEFKDIKIASSNSMCEYLIPCTLYTYRKKDRNIRFVTKCDYTKNVIEDILKYKADVGFITMAIEDKDLVCTKLNDNDLVLIYSPNNKEVDKAKTLEDIASIGFLIGPEESGIRKAIENIFISNNISFENVNIHMELGSIEAIKTSVIENHGISIVPYVTVKKELYLGTLKTKEIEGISLKCDICMIYQKNYQHEEHINKFIEYMNKFGKDTFC
ncbi:LysR family transcriptional regulator [Tissierella sp. MSJ-40]|uniref:LysR family transcriptional regulator n=1 Tax=Tissierella simiarum TaxID=2841534 RepID=A0ABS6EBV3_9FIRM|nr:LysR family transcriptional regulator [Tissierella simiarum]MBU5439689.1 LysR family transcriptional regulator [Tissierella simiarum]